MKFAKTVFLFCNIQFVFFNLKGADICLLFSKSNHLFVKFNDSQPHLLVSVTNKACICC